ncbi:hypothetical protein [Phaeobacter inhibens]|uniref:Uncharacterized protein n=1 Tax=Phaeobacter inhibens TaxID=221822 RepID=A0A2I7KDY2_9RHOB|nr:hypothetical protein [Phaeobacter inhibens]AUR00796.1 hypothetical protein PhaeoP88_03475 [Phaeobacter inhibens]
MFNASDYFTVNTPVEEKDMPNKQQRRTWPLISRISPRAAELLKEAEALDGISIDFADMFEWDHRKLKSEEERLKTLLNDF